MTSQNDEMWDLYWETRLQPLENLGKRAAILAASGLILRLAPEAGHPLRLLELGCGEGQVIGALVQAHFQVCDLPKSVGVDYDAASLATFHRNYPDLPYVQADFTDPELLASLGKFDLVLLVNALHEVFSDCYASELGRIDFPAARLRVEQALAGAADCLQPGGCLVLLDGLEPPGNPDRIVRLRLRDHAIRQEFTKFADQYRPWPIAYQEVAGPLTIELSQRDFTRYITKSIFVEKRLWASERMQSYQYFTEQEFRAAFARQNLEIFNLNTLTMNEDKWRYRVDIETPGFRFPDEHILIQARKATSRVFRNSLGDTPDLGM